jgi:hypothetical protein
VSSNNIDPSQPYKIDKAIKLTNECKLYTF